jgi:ribosomal-protein-alanine N-acetyltransferase
MSIITPGSVLREWSFQDAKSLARHADNPHIAAMMKDAFPSPYTLDDAYRFIARATSPSASLLFAIEREGEAVGGIGIHPRNGKRHRSADIGYWLSESCWGKGIITGAVRSLVPVVFGKWDIVRLQAGVLSNNPASMRVLEKCGFIRKAVHRNAVTKQGVRLDEVSFVNYGPAREHKTTRKRTADRKTGVQSA